MRASASWQERRRVLHRAVAAVLAVCAAAAPAGGEEYRYTVAPGDTLTGIGQRLLTQARDWRPLQKINRLADPDRLTPGQTLLIPLRLLRRIPLEAEVIHVAGKVRSGDKPLAVGSVLAESVPISTEDNAFATLRLPDGSIVRLQPRSTFRLVSGRKVGNTAAYDVRVELKTGRIESDVAKVNRAGGRFEISAPQTTVGIRGTRLRVAAEEEGASAVELVQGEIGVQAGRYPQIARLRAGEGWIVDRRHARGLTLPLLAAPELSGMPALQERVKVAISFAPLAGAVRYRAQIAADERFSAIVAEGLFDRPEAKFVNLDDGQYWVRIRGVDSHGLEGYDGQAEFRLKARPEPPFASAPLNGGKAWGDTVRFAWSASTADRYRFQLARDPGFNECLVDVDGLQAVEFEAPLKLAPGEYFWRVGSIRGDGERGPFGDTQRFSLKAPTQAEVPAVDGGDVVFTWSGGPGQVFDFELAKDAGFTEVIDARRLEQARVALPKPGPGTYFMRVRATDPDGFSGPYSATQRFEVPAPWWLLLVVLGPFL